MAKAKGMRKSPNGNPPKVEIVPLTQFRPQVKNINLHTPYGTKLLDDSIHRDGYISAITVAADDMSFDGSNRIERGVDGGFTEAIVVESDGTRPVVIRRTDIKTAKSEKARRLSFLANHITSVDFNPDAALLRALARDDQISAQIVKQNDQLRKLLAGNGQQAETAEVGELLDRASQLQEKWQTKLGQQWQLGAHNLLIGDSTELESLERLMQGEKADLVATDPPYNVDIDYGTPSTDSKSESDYREFISSWFNLARGISNQLLLTPGTGRGMGMPNLRLWYAIAPPDWVLVWVKRNTVGHSSLGGFNAWEPIFFYGKPKKIIPQDIYDIPITVQQDVADKEGNKLHPTPKQIRLWEAILSDFTNTGDIVYEPFCGSGTTLVACENLGRQCRAIEINPNYAAVIIERWAGLTGSLPVLCDQ